MRSHAKIGACSRGDGSTTSARPSITGRIDTCVSAILRKPGASHTVVCTRPQPSGPCLSARSLSTGTGCRCSRESRRARTPATMPGTSTSRRALTSSSRTRTWRITWSTTVPRHTECRTITSMARSVNNLRRGTIPPGETHVARRFAAAFRGAGRFRGRLFREPRAQLRQARPRHARVLLQPHPHRGQRSDRAHPSRSTRRTRRDARRPLAFTDGLHGVGEAALLRGGEVAELYADVVAAVGFGDPLHVAGQLEAACALRLHLVLDEE